MLAYAAQAALVHNSSITGMQLDHNPAVTSRALRHLREILATRCCQHSSSSSSSLSSSSSPFSRGVKPVKEARSPLSLQDLKATPPSADVAVAESLQFAEERKVREGLQISAALQVRHSSLDKQAAAGTEIEERSNRGTEIEGRCKRHATLRTGSRGMLTYADVCMLLFELDHEQRRAPLQIEAAWVFACPSLSKKGPCPCPSKRCACPCRSKGGPSPCPSLSKRGVLL